MTTERFVLAARFPSPPKGAGGQRAFLGAKEAVQKNPEADLFVSHGHDADRVYSVYIAGTPPPQPLEAQLRQLLSTGEIVELPEGTVASIFEYIEVLKKTSQTLQ